MARTRKRAAKPAGAPIPRRRGRPPRTEIDHELALRIRRLREERGMTQAQLAGSDFSKGFISLLETGRTGLSLRAAQILAGRFGVGLEELVIGEREPAPAILTYRALADALGEIASQTLDPLTRARIEQVASRAKGLGESQRKLVNADGVRARVGQAQRALAAIEEALRS